MPSVIAGHLAANFLAECVLYIYIFGCVLNSCDEEHGGQCFVWVPPSFCQFGALSLSLSLIFSCAPTIMAYRKGLLLLVGAQPASGATPGMIGYGVAKAAVHQLSQSLAAPGSGLPADAAVITLRPYVFPPVYGGVLHCAPPAVSLFFFLCFSALRLRCWGWGFLNDRMTLDTPGNRAGMPNANFAEWTSLQFVAELRDFLLN